MSKGLHRLVKYLNLEGFLEKSLEMKSALKSTGKLLKSLEKSLNSTISIGLSTVDRDLNQYEIVVPLFGAAYAAQNIGTTIYTNFPVLLSPLSQSSISEEDLKPKSVFFINIKSLKTV